MSFKCTQCGLCCTRIDRALSEKDHLYQGLIDEFPFKPDESGACEKYDKETKKCTVYDTRPRICRVDLVKELYHSDMSAEEYNAASEEACKVLQSL